MKAFFQRMFRYMAWADRRTVDSLKAVPAAQAEALPLLAHVLAAEHVWLSRLQQQAPRYAVWPELTLAECRQLADANAAAYHQYLDPLREDQLQLPVQYRTSQGLAMTSQVQDILMQVVTHGPYHRGQIAKVIGRHNGKPLNTDFIMFARESVPAS